MRLERILMIASFVCGVLLSASCEKQGARLYDGSYSFKTSGILTIDRTTKDSGQASKAEEDSPWGDLPDISLPDLPDINLPEGDRTFNLSLSAESGQMNIIRTSDEDVVVTMNIIGGGALVFDGTVSENTLVLSPVSRVVSFRDGAQSVNLDIEVEGTAVKYGDVVIFTLTYTGKGENVLYDYSVKSSDVKCVAKFNR